MRFGLTLVLAAKLGPEAYGLLGMVTVITGFVGYFTEFGLITSIVQKKEIDDLDCDTVFWSSIFLSVIMYAMVFFLAPLMGLYYSNQVSDKQELILITRVIFLEFLILPFNFVPAALEVKKIKYDLISISGIISVAISAVIALILAFMDYGVWALVYQQLSLTFCSTILLWIFTRWSPKLHFSFGRFKTLFSFGAHVTFNNLINFFSGNVDYLLISRLLGPRELGIYTLAFRLSRYPLEKGWSFFGKMLFPAFSTFQDDMSRLRKNFFRISVSGGLILIPPLLMIFFGAEAIIELLGKKWASSIEQMALIIRIFAGYLIVQTVCYADEPMLMALKKVHILNIYKTLISVLLLVFGFFGIKDYGLDGMALVFMVMTLLYIVIIKFVISSMLSISIGEMFKNIKHIFPYSLLSATAGFLVYHFVPDSFGRVTFLVILCLVIGVISTAMLFNLKIIRIMKPFFDVDGVIYLDKETSNGQ
jgi:O-antigen/teichoic acid export membrane protein